MKEDLGKEVMVDDGHLILRELHVQLNGIPSLVQRKVNITVKKENQTLPLSRHN